MNNITPLGRVLLSVCCMAATLALIVRLKIKLFLKSKSLFLKAETLRHRIFSMATSYKFKSKAGFSVYVCVCDTRRSTRSFNLLWISYKWRYSPNYSLGSCGVGPFGAMSRVQKSISPGIPINKFNLNKFKRPFRIANQRSGVLISF